MPDWEREWLLLDEHLAAAGDAPWWEVAEVNPDDLTAEEWAEACAASREPAGAGGDATTTMEGRR